MNAGSHLEHVNMLLAKVGSFFKETEHKVNYEFVLLFSFDFESQPGVQSHPYSYSYTRLFITGRAYLKHISHLAALFNHPGWWRWFHV